MESLKEGGKIRAKHIPTYPMYIIKGHHAVVLVTTSNLAVDRLKATSKDPGRCHAEARYSVAKRRYAVVYNHKGEPVACYEQGSDILLK